MMWWWEDTGEGFAVLSVSDSSLSSTLTLGSMEPLPEGWTSSGYPLCAHIPPKSLRRSVFGICAERPNSRWAASR